jgi:hypothetical protein
MSFRRWSTSAKKLSGIPFVTIASISSGDCSAEMDKASSRPAPPPPVPSQYVLGLDLGAYDTELDPEAIGERAK